MQDEDLDVMLYFPGDRAIKLTIYIIESCLKPVKVVDSELELINALTCSTCKRIYCVFLIFKFSFPMLIYYV